MPTLFLSSYVAVGCMDTVWYEVNEEKELKKKQQSPQRAEFNLAK